MYLPGVFAPQPSVLNGKARPKLIMLSSTPCHAVLRCAVLVQGAGAQVVNRQTVEVASGAQAAIYTADMRAQVRQGQGRVAAGQASPRAGLLQGNFAPGQVCGFVAGQVSCRAYGSQLGRRASSACLQALLACAPVSAIPSTGGPPCHAMPTPAPAPTPTASARLLQVSVTLYNDAYEWAEAGPQQNCACHARKCPACRPAGVLHALHRCVRVGGGWAANHQRGPHGWVRLGPEVCVRLRCRRTKAGHAGAWFRS